eukprot:292037_1
MFHSLKPTLNLPIRVVVLGQKQNKNVLRNVRNMSFLPSIFRSNRPQTRASLTDDMWDVMNPNLPALSDVWGMNQPRGPFDILSSFPQALAFQREPEFEQLTSGKRFRIPLRTDIQEHEKEFVIKSDICGVPKRDIDINIENDEYLVIKGERSCEKEEIDDTYHRTERLFGSFNRKFKLPANVVLDKDTKIDAKAENGVLTIKLPKTEETPAIENVRHVEIE